MNGHTRIFVDRYSLPLARGRYRIMEPKRKDSVDGFIYRTEQGIWMVEDLAADIGSTKRFRMVSAYPTGTEFVRLDFDGVEMEPSRGGYEMPSLLDELARLEQQAFACKAEQRRIEHMACQLLGCSVGDCSQVSEAAFDLAFNAKSAESVIKARDNYYDSLEDSRNGQD
jgi:hypothetical protein